jgi:hypothetical protein
VLVPLGSLCAATAWLSVVLIGLVAGTASFTCLALRVPPPREYLIVLGVLAGPVLHLFEAGVFTRAVSWARSCLARLARARFRWDQTSPAGLSSCAWRQLQTVSQSRASISSVIAALTCEFRLSHMSITGPPSCWWATSSSWHRSVTPLRIVRQLA